MCQPAAAVPTCTDKVRSCLGKWRQIGANSRVLQWLQQGVPITWASHLRPRPFYLAPIPLTPQHQQYWDQVLQPQYLATGAIQDITAQQDRWCCVHQAFLVDKATEDGSPATDFRLVINLKPINAFCTQPKFRFETVQQLCESSKLACHFVKVDLADAFHHVPLHPSHKKYFQFSLGARVFECQALPFGWSASPYVFAKCMKCIVRHLRQRARSQGDPLAIQFLLNYLDDFVCSAGTYAQAKYFASEFKQLLHQLGLTCKDKKCQWQPVQQITALGILIDSTTGQLSLPLRRIRSIRRAAQTLLTHAQRHKRWVHKRALARFTGKAVSSMLAVPLARYQLQHCHDAFTQCQGWADHAQVRLHHAALAELRWWARASSYEQTSPWHKPTVTCELFTDSSDFGWGGVLHRLGNTYRARGFWYQPERAAHITLKELAAVRRCIQSFLHVLPGSVVQLHSDASAVVGVLSNLCTRSKPLRQELARLHDILTQHNIQLQPVHIAGILNTAADALSRCMDAEDWRLTDRWFNMIQQRFRLRFTCDRFASAENAQCMAFWSAHWQPGASGVDSFTATWEDWHAHINWMNPPWSRLFDVACLCRDMPDMEGAVLTPYWPAAPWFPMLEARSRAMLILPKRWGLFTSGRHGSGTPAPAPKWDLVAFRL